MSDGICPIRYLSAGKMNELELSFKKAIAKVHTPAMTISLMMLRNVEIFISSMRITVAP